MPIETTMMMMGQTFVFPARRAADAVVVERDDDDEDDDCDADL